MIILFLLLNIWHPLKMSVGQLTFNDEKNYFELELRVFGDDFLEAQDLSIPEHMISPSIVQKYIGDNLIFWFNGIEQRMKFVRMETEGPSIVSYWRVKCRDVQCSAVNDIRCENNILLQTFKRQQNIIRLDLPNRTGVMLFRQNDNVQQLKI